MKGKTKLMAGLHLVHDDILREKIQFLSKGLSGKPRKLCNNIHDVKLIYFKLKKSRSGVLG